VMIYFASHQYDKTHYPSSDVARGSELFAKANQFCDVKCLRAASEAEADVVFSYTHKTRVLRGDKDKQIWVGTFWEAIGHYPPISFNYDFTVSYRADASFPNFQMMWDAARNLEVIKSQPVVPFSLKRESFGDVAVFVSNCDVSGAWDTTGRVKTIETLGGSVKIDSYGTCLRNRVEADDLGRLLELLMLNTTTGSGSSAHHAATGTASSISSSEHRLYADSPFSYLREWIADASQAHPRYEAYDRNYAASHNWGTKMALASAHRFTLAAENSICAYYHTEKVWHALLAGSVPIYIGATTIKEYVPANSLIMVSDFPSIGALSDFLVSVGADKQKYDKFLEWRSKPLPENVRSKLQAEKKLLSGEWQCEMCRTFQRGRPAAGPVPKQTLSCDKDAAGTRSSLLQIETEGGSGDGASSDEAHLGIGIGGKYPSTALELMRTLYH